MRKVVSSDYSIFAVAAGKNIHWKVSIKKTAVLNEAQSAGTWIDVTDHLDKSMPDKISESIELLIGQFATTVLNFKGLDIAWWKANIFNATQYLELKVEFWINNLTTDTITPFGGWIDKKKDGKWCVTNDEATDSVVFSVAGYLEYAARTSAIDISTQILNNDVNGAGLVGLRMEKLLGVYPTNANVTSYPLKKGIHSIQLSFTAGSPNVWTASLDGGTEVTLPVSDGAITLGNGNGTVGDLNEFDTQKLTLYIKVAELVALTESVTQEIIQKVTGTVLPNTWFNHIWVFRLLHLMFTKIGITSYTFDDFRMPTYDGRRVPSLWEVPPGDSYYDTPSAIAHDATNNLVWIGIKDKVYKYNPTTLIYTYACTFDSGDKVVKLWSEDVASGYIWGVIRGTAGLHKIFRIEISAEPDIYNIASITRTTTTKGEERNFAIDLSLRGIFYTSNNSGNQRIYFFSLNSFSEIYYTIYTPILIDLPAFSDGAGNYYHQVQDGDYFIGKSTYNGTSWFYDSMTFSMDCPILNAVYCQSMGLWVGSRLKPSVGWQIVRWSPVKIEPSIVMAEYSEAVGFVADEVHKSIYWLGSTDAGLRQSVKRIYLSAELVLNGGFDSSANWEYWGTGWSISGGKAIHTTGWSDIVQNNLTIGRTIYAQFDVSGFSSGPVNFYPGGVTVSYSIPSNGHYGLVMVTDGNFTCFGAAYGVEIDNVSVREILTETFAEKIPVGFIFDELSYSNRICYDSIADRLIGILNPQGILFEFGTSVSMYIAAEASYDGMTIYDALKEFFGFNLMPRISGGKLGFVYRRFDVTGLPVTTGHTVTLDADNAKNISEEMGYNDAYDVVTVDNGVNSESCDINGFDASAMGDEKELSITNRFIADNLLKDFAKWYYNYWKTSKTRNKVPTPLIPFFQYEPFDGAQLSFAGKIQTTDTGVIIGQGISQDGTTEFEVVV